MKHHLAQANIARFKASLDDPIMKEFVDFIGPINKLAEESPGFVWRLKDDEGRSSSYIESPFRDEMLAINLSVWEDLPSLKNFVYTTVHSYFLRNKKKWFQKDGKSQFVMWWIPEGEVPTLELTKQKLELLDTNGPTPEAFSIKQLFDVNGNTIAL
ncbi:hypothetical protein GCM10011414_00400 [Croceivirga lutea]|uniref:DUF3291 domain-containing protein n=1 Tax=Croceivirga lutea TaxID=1775167 RepID=UPI00163AF161|nr:DUF3291 domain-containing protein [Croceivirga lutea]GGG34898.1 hypothetical protein GCM10011414_00400 [Croceivirga lutea]